MSLAVLPLAITMNAGPQIMSALIFVTAAKPLKLSAYFLAGLLLLSIFPSDFVVLMTVGVNLEQSDSSLLAALPFVAATVLIAALPVLSYLLFRRRAEVAMPKVRDWMNTHSWLVNIIVYVVFILLILA